MPFYWVGAIFSAAFLAIVITIFGLLLKIGGSAATEVRASILPGLVAGIRNWADDEGTPTPAVSSPRAGGGGASVEEAPAPEGLRMERVRRAH
jgi:hypothetical protein